MRVRARARANKLDMADGYTAECNAMRRKAQARSVVFCWKQSYGIEHTTDRGSSTG